MAQDNSLGRPYARAIFELAKEAGDYKGWSSILASAAQVVEDASVNSLIDDPRIDREKVAGLVTSVIGSDSAEVNNMIRLLSHNDRLQSLPSVAAQYEIMRAEAESIIDVEMISARKVTKAQKDKVSAALEKRMGRKVKISVAVDEDLLGGAIIRAGDLVIDGSAKGRLEKLSSALGS